MRKGFAALAFVGVAACVALYAVTQTALSSSLYTNVTGNNMEFIRFGAKYGRSYATKEEFELRANIFQQNYARILEENLNKDNTFTLEINEFADWTPNEFKRMLSPIKTESSNSTTSLVDSSDCIPSSIDWRNEIAVNKVKDQGRFCASGYAFSAMSSIESRYKIKSGTLYTLSEQQIIDCSGFYGNSGC